MWAAIQRNRRRSLILLMMLGLLLLALGYLIGAVVHFELNYHQADFSTTTDYYESLTTPEPETSIRPVLSIGQQLTMALRESWRSGLIGMVIAAMIWLIMIIVAFISGDSILLSTVGAFPIAKESAPQLYNVVEEMSIAAGLPTVPRVCIINEHSPNAFAAGRDPRHAVVAVTAGLLKRLNRDELQGVIAHEIGHIKNLDIRFMTLAGVLVGAIVLISDIFWRSFRYGGSQRRSDSKGGGQAQLILLAVAILVAILAPLVAQMLYLACSRRREYLADASAAQFTRYPPGLAGALKKITDYTTRWTGVNRAVAPMFIINPLHQAAAFSLFATHPPTEERIRILLSMGGQAGLYDYEQAFRQVHGQKNHCLDAATLKSAEQLPARSASTEELSADPIVRSQQVADLLDVVSGGVIPVACGCGLKIKLPVNFKKERFTCPRCGLVHELPRATINDDAQNISSESRASARSDTIPAAFAVSYQRRTAGWESFQCPCGGVVQLSPSFSAPAASCKKCGRHVKIQPPNN
ncbi:MAG: Protease HtpX [Phycisphaerae bacterium]|nr:Protease HtpX [Phycisphaerae bacterium]